MTILFTKTCARDAKRAFYQAHAAHRLLRGYAYHLLLIEREELDRVPQLLSLQKIGVRVVTVEHALPTLMAIRSPYLRQQFCKLWAPVHYGEDMVQLDSDMCPRRECSLLDVFGLASRPVWCFASEPKPHLMDTIREWRASLIDSIRVSPDTTIQDDFARASSAARKAPLHSYMREQYGWWVKPEVAEEVVKRVDPQRIVGKFSEYQVLGWFARRYFEGAYDWRDVSAGGSRAINKEWVFHHTSAEPLERGTEWWLQDLAGGVRWPAS